MVRRGHAAPRRSAELAHRGGPDEARRARPSRHGQGLRGLRGRRAPAPVVPRQPVAAPSGQADLRGAAGLEHRPDCRDRGRSTFRPRPAPTLPFSSARSACRSTSSVSVPAATSTCRCSARRPPNHARLRRRWGRPGARPGRRARAVRGGRGDAGQSWNPRLDGDRSEEIDADLFVIGPEAPLVAGLADRLRGRGPARLRTGGRRRPPRGIEGVDEGCGRRGGRSHRGPRRLRARSVLPSSSSEDCPGRTW